MFVLEAVPASRESHVLLWEKLAGTPGTKPRLVDWGVHVAFLFAGYLQPNQSAARSTLPLQFCELDARDCQIWFRPRYHRRHLSRA